MNETTLRWKGRIRSLKTVGALLLILLVVISVHLVIQLVWGLESPSEPEPVTIEQLMSDTTGTYEYVTIQG